MLKVAGGVSGGGSGTVTQVDTGTGLTGGPITTTGTVSLANTAVTAATYGNASTVGTFTVNAQGQLTNAANTSIAISVAAVSGAVPNTVNVLTSGLLSGGGALTGNVTVSLTSVPSGNVTGLGTMATQNANAVAITGGTVNSTTLNSVTLASGSIAINVANVTTTTAASATFATSSLPLVPAGYLSINLNGTVVKVPYYAV